MALHANSTCVLSPLAGLKVGEEVKADTGELVKLADVGDHEGAETYKNGTCFICDLSHPCL
jgi:hypothetical protein